jgi:hypothetical protein
MRTELQPFEGKTSLFIATFGKYGTWRSRGITGRSILLRDLKTGTGRLLADHTWINYTAGFDAAGEFVRGEQVRFTAGVKPYCKGYFGQKIGDRFARVPGLDYRLSFPRNVERLGTVQPCDGTMIRKEPDQHSSDFGRTNRTEVLV